MIGAMDRPALSAVAFALAAGDPTDARAVVHVDAAPGPGGRRLLASVEPLEPSARGHEVAALALIALRAAFAAAADLPAEHALRRAFAAANAAVLAENRPLSAGRWDRRVYVGAVALALAGRDLTIAQVPASQAIIVQDGRCYAFPDLASWRCDYVPEVDRLVGACEPDPLGVRDTVRPDIARTVTAPGDLILLCSTGIARGLARETAAPGDPLLGKHLAPALERLERVAVAYELDDAHAAGIVLGRGLDAVTLATASSPTGATAPDGGAEELTAIPNPVAPRRGRPLVPALAAFAGRGGRPLLNRPGASWRRRAFAAVGIPLDRDLAWADARPDDRNDADDPGFSDPSPIDTDAAPAFPTVAGGPVPALVERDAPPAETRHDDAFDALPAPDAAALRGPLGVTAAHLPPVLTDGAAIGPHVRRARTLARLQLGIVALTEHLVLRRREPAMAFPARITLAAPGARSVRCYRERSAVPVEWRTRLPRGPVVHLPGRVLSVVLVLLLTFGTSGVAFGRYRDRFDRAQDSLAAVDAHLAAVTAATDAAVIDTRLAEAQDALGRAANNGADDDDVAARRLAVTAAQDRVRGVSRFVEFARVGALPPALIGRSARLIRAGAEVYVVGGAFYRLDPTARRLVVLLAPGTRVGGEPVGDLGDAAWDDGGVVATDGVALYALGDRGWTRRALGLIDDQMPWTATACAAFQGSFYALEADAGMVLKFPAEALAAVPEDWAGAEDRELLRGARDLAIDGRVHVLLADGRVRTYFRGSSRGDLALDVTPPLANPVALYSGPGNNFLYLADAAPTAPPADDEAPATGRVLRLDPNGGPVRQLLPPSDADPAAADALAGARDLVVDEGTGTVYVLTADAIWRATLPPPGSVA